MSPKEPTKKSVIEFWRIFGESIFAESTNLRRECSHFAPGFANAQNIDSLKQWNK